MFCQVFPPFRRLVHGLLFLCQDTPIASCYHFLIGPDRRILKKGLRRTVRSVKANETVLIGHLEELETVGNAARRRLTSSGLLFSEMDQGTSSRHGRHKPNHDCDAVNGTHC
jgi:hypothetical protein